MNNSISITFGVPNNGWLPVDIRYNDFALAFYASDVLNDAVEELYYAIINLNNNIPKRVTWWTEPGAIFFDFEKKGDDVQLKISETDDLHNEKATTRELKVIVGNDEQIIDPIRNTLIGFCSQPYEENHWPYNLDKSKLANLMTSG